MFPSCFVYPVSRRQEEKRTASEGKKENVKEVRGTEEGRNEEREAERVGRKRRYKHRFLTCDCVIADTVSANLFMLTWLWPLTICFWKSLSMYDVWHLGRKRFHYILHNRWVHCKGKSNNLTWHFDFAQQFQGQEVTKKFEQFLTCQNTIKPMSTCEVSSTLSDWRFSVSFLCSSQAPDLKKKSTAGEHEAVIYKEEITVMNTCIKYDTANVKTKESAHILRRRIYRFHSIVLCRAQGTIVMRWLLCGKVSKVSAWISGGWEPKRLGVSASFNIIPEWKPASLLS